MAASNFIHRGLLRFICVMYVHTTYHNSICFIVHIRKEQVSVSVPRLGVLLNKWIGRQSRDDDVRRHLTSTITINRGFFFMYVLYSTLFHLPPLRFHCVGGCWDRTQESCDFGIGCQTLEPLGYISSTLGYISSTLGYISSTDSATAHPHSATVDCGDST